MPDHRRHRGRHPADARLFDDAALPALCAAVADLSWLLGRGYSDAAAVALVGDRYQLRERQRRAALRAACAEDAARERRHRRLALPALRGRAVAVDGFNCLITVEAALSGGVLLRGRDGALRDLASVHGSYRTVSETREAIEAIGQELARAAPSAVCWYLDRPVSNSGRLRQLLDAVAAERAWPWQVALVDDPDRLLAADPDRVVATSDAWILDRCAAWVGLSEAAIARCAPAAWLVDLAPDREA
jgi:hypothetical protein